MFIKKDILCNFKLLIACVLVVLMIFSVFNLNTLHVREELVYSDSTMSAIVYADAGMENMNSAGSVNVVLNDSLIESLENDLNTTIMQSTNELIWEKEAQAKAEAEAKAKAEAEAKAQAAVNANYGVEPVALSNTQVEATETQGTQTFKKNGLTFTYDPNLVYVNMENIEQRFKVYAPNDTFEGAATTLAKMALGEAGGCSKTEIAGTMWCVLNRYDEGYANSIHKVTTAKGAFYGYKSGNKVRDDIFAIAKDVLARWVAEKEGNTNVGRVLPSGYNWFLGDGKHNNYRNNYKGRSNWNWTLATPYLE